MQTPWKRIPVQVRRPSVLRRSGATESQPPSGIDAALRFVIAIEKSPPPWYQALETALIGTGVFCFCFGESDPGQAVFFESDPWFPYTQGGFALEDVVNGL